MKAQRYFFCFATSFATVCAPALGGGSGCEPVVLGSVNVVSFSNGAVQDGDFLYVTNVVANIAVQIVDISNLAQPTVIGVYTPPNLLSHTWGHSVQIVGSRMYVTENFFGGLHIADISDPTNPLHLGSFTNITGPMTELVVKSNLAYIATSGLLILDISDPESIHQVGFVETPGDPNGLMILGHGSRERAYLLEQESGLTVLDIADPTQPEIVGSFDTNGQASDFSSAGSKIYIADGHQGLVALNIFEPSNPQLIHTLNGIGKIDFLSARGSGIFASGFTLDEILVVDASSAADPFVAQTFPVGDITSFAFSNHQNQIRSRHLFAISSSNQLQIYDIECITGCPADFNSDGSLDFHDIAGFLGSTPDLNGDGDFDFFDVSIFLVSFAEGCFF